MAAFFLRGLGRPTLGLRPGFSCSTRLGSFSFSSSAASGAKLDALDQRRLEGIPAGSEDFFERRDSVLERTYQDNIRPPKLQMPKTDYTHYGEVIEDLFLRLRQPWQPGYGWRSMAPKRIISDDPRIMYHWTDFKDGCTRVAVRPPPGGAGFGFLEFHWWSVTALFFYKPTIDHKAHYLSWELPGRWLTQLKMQQWPESCPILFPIDRQDAEEHLEFLARERDQKERQRRKSLVYGLLETPPWVDQTKITAADR